MQKKVSAAERVIIQRRLPRLGLNFQFNRLFLIGLVTLLLVFASACGKVAKEYVPDEVVDEGRSVNNAWSVIAPGRSSVEMFSYFIKFPPMLVGASTSSLVRV